MSSINCAVAPSFFGVDFPSFGLVIGVEFSSFWVVFWVVSSTFWVVYGGYIAVLLKLPSR